MLYALCGHLLSSGYAAVVCTGLGIKSVLFSLLSRPSITDVRRVGYFSSDQTTQTDNSDILELKYVTGTIGSIIEVALASFPSPYVLSLVVSSDL